MFLDNDITYLHGVGPKKAALLNSEIKVKTYRDMLYYFPYRYIDKSRFYDISELNDTSSYVQVKGKILRMDLVGSGRQQRAVAMFSDGKSSMELLWFKGVKYAA
jgi:ATP-dependent DNA helicase RecG